jgi:hypothetical protein
VLCSVAVGAAAVCLRITGPLALPSMCHVCVCPAGLDGSGGASDHAPHTAEDCYMRFETLSMREEKLFYHADQVGREGVTNGW